MKEDYNQIGLTGILCARVRGKRMNMPYAKEIAKKLGNGADAILGWRLPLIECVGRVFPNLFAKVSLLEGRYLSTNDAIRKFGDCSILELAAGLSPRGLEYGKGDFQYVETDGPHVIGLKERVVRDIRKAKGEEMGRNHRFEILDAREKTHFERVGQLFQEMGNTKPIVIVNEGLFGYYPIPVRAGMRDNIKFFLETYSPNGAWITSDFSMPIKENPIIQWIKNVIKRRTKGDFTYFKDSQAVSNFLDEGGLRGEQLPNEHLIDKLTCTETLGISRGLLKEVAKSYRAYITRLK